MNNLTVNEKSHSYTTTDKHTLTFYTEWLWSTENILNAIYFM